MFARTDAHMDVQIHLRTMVTSHVFGHCNIVEMGIHSVHISFEHVISHYLHCMKAILVVQIPNGST